MVLPTDGFDAHTPQPFREVPPYAVEFEKGGLAFYAEGHPACTFVVKDEHDWRSLMRSDAYQLALAFIKSKFDIEGDLVAAIKVYRSLFVKRSKPALKTIAAYLWH